MERLRVFVSSKMEELGAERKAVKKALGELLVDAWVFEADAGARSTSIRETYLGELGDCDVYVGLFWKEFGEYTIDEFNEAKRLRKPRLIYEKRHEIDGERDPALRDFLDQLGKVETGLTIKRFHTPAELLALVKEDFARLLAAAFRGRFTKAPHPAPIHVPRMPRYFVGRDRLVKEIVRELLSKHYRAFSVEGMAGVGKTTLAAAVVHDAEIKAHFANGVLWGSLGPRGDPMDVLAAWGQELGTDVSELLDERARASAVAEALRNQRRLLVIDDAWELEPALLLCCGGPDCCHLLTTRDKIIAREFARPRSAMGVPVLDDEVAFGLLRKLAPEAAAADVEAVGDLARAVGGLPLALELLGGALATAASSLFPGFSDVMQDTTAELADPRRWLKLAKQHAGVDRKLTLEETVKISLQGLPTEAVKTFHSLGAFAAKPVRFDRAAAEAVAQSGGRTLVLLGARNLVQIEGTSLQLHPTIAEVARIGLDQATIDRHSKYYLALVRADPYDVSRIFDVYGQIRRAWSEHRSDPSVLDWLTALSPYFGLRGNWREYLDLARTCVSVSERNGLTGATGALEANLGLAQYYLGERTEAVKYSNQALRTLYEAGDLGGLARTLHNLGLFSYEEGSYEKSLGYFNLSLPLLTKAEDVEGQRAVFANMSRVHTMLGHAGPAAVFWEQERFVSRKIERNRTLAERVEVGLAHDLQLERQLREHPMLLGYLNAVVAMDDGEAGLNGDIVVGVKQEEDGVTRWWRVRFQDGKKIDQAFLSELPKEFDAGVALGERDALWVMGAGSRPSEKERLHIKTGDSDLLNAFLARYLKS